MKYDLVLAVYVPEHSPKLTFHPALTELASKLMGWFRDFKKTLIQEYLTWHLAVNYIYSSEQRKYPFLFG